MRVVKHWNRLPRR